MVWENIKKILAPVIGSEEPVFEGLEVNDNNKESSLTSGTLAVREGCEAVDTPTRPIMPRGIREMYH